MRTILHISKYYPPYNGGIEAVAHQMVDSLSDYQNIVLCFSSDKQDHEDIVDGVPVYRVGVQYTFRSQALSINYLHVLRQLLHKYHPDAIHLHAPNPFVYPMVRMLIPRSTKLVVHWHSDILGKGKAYGLVRNTENKILARSNRIIATSPNYIYESQPLKPYADKVLIVPNGVETDSLELQPGDEEAICKIRAQYDNKRIVLFIGRHIYYKGLEWLIKSDVYIKSDVQILIAGDGPLSEDYKTMAASHPRIKFLGRVSQTERRQYLWAADVFAFPSINKAEAFGVALAEAMYCRCVPVVFHIPGSGVNWVNKDGITGMEVPLKDTKAFAHAVDSVLMNEQMMLRMAEEAHNRVVEKFSREVIAEAIQNFYSELFSPFGD